MSAYLGTQIPRLPTMSAGAANEQLIIDKKCLQPELGHSRLEYSFKNRYLFEGVFRYDGLQVAEGINGLLFGFSWLIISEENLLKNILGEQTSSSPSVATWA